MEKKAEEILEKHIGDIFSLQLPKLHKQFIVAAMEEYARRFASQSLPSKEITIWHPISEIPREGFELLGYNPEWIDEDFNPDGTRIGTPCGDGNWETARWNASHDCYISDNDKMPTHWAYLPKFKM